MVEFSGLGAKVEFLRGRSFNSIKPDVVVVAAVTVVVATVVVAVVVVAVVVVPTVVVATVVVAVAVEGFDGTFVDIRLDVVLVAGLAVVAAIVVKLFEGLVKLIIRIEELTVGVAFVLIKVLDSPPKVAFDLVLEIDSTGIVKPSGGAAVTSRSMCFSVDDIVVNMGSMTGRIVVVKSMC